MRYGIEYGRESKNIIEGNRIMETDHEFIAENIKENLARWPKENSPNTLALRKYGEHISGCQFDEHGPVCDCGLWDALGVTSERK